MKNLIKNRKMRFSNFLGKSGNKESAHFLLLCSLFLLRQAANQEAARKKRFSTLHKGKGVFLCSSIIKNSESIFELVKQCRWVLETRQLRKGRTTYKIPKVLSRSRQEGRVLAFLSENLRSSLSRSDNKQRFSSDLAVSRKSSWDSSFLSRSDKEENSDKDWLWVKTRSSSGCSFLKKKKATMFSFKNPSFLSRSENELRSNTSLGGASTTLSEAFQEPRGPATREKSLNRRNSPLSEALTRIESCFTKQFLQNRNSFLSRSENELRSNFDAHNGQVGALRLSFAQKEGKKDDFWIRSQPKILKKSSIKLLQVNLLDSLLQKGVAFEKKKQLHLFALKNRAYLHFRWW